MPHAQNNDLPPSVRSHLPSQAQAIFRAAFNHTWLQYATAGARREEIARRIAWAAVKRRYHKQDRDWVMDGALH